MHQVDRALLQALESTRIQSGLYLYVQQQRVVAHELQHLAQQRRALAHAAIQRAYLVPGEVGNLAMAISRAVDGVVVHDYNPPIRRQRHVQFDAVRAQFGRAFECRQRVFGELLACASVRPDQRVHIYSSSCICLPIMRTLHAPSQRFAGHEIAHAYPIARRAHHPARSRHSNTTLAGWPSAASTASSERTAQPKLRRNSSASSRTRARSAACVISIVPPFRASALFLPYYSTV